MENVEQDDGNPHHGAVKDVRVHFFPGDGVVQAMGVLNQAEDNAYGDQENDGELDVEKSHSASAVW